MTTLNAKMKSPNLRARYQHLPGPVGKLLEGTYCTTASVPISPYATLVYTTSHLGLDLQTGVLIRESLQAEVEAIFDCLDAALKNAGVIEGCGQAFKFTCCMRSVQQQSTVEAVFKGKWAGHQPAWVAVIVSDFVGGPGMNVEIAAEAVIYSDEW